MKILILGGGGMLGHKLVQILQTDFDVWLSLRSGYEKYEKFGIFEKHKIVEGLNVLDFKKN